ncbi:tRNA pseudouridine(38-40) synthase TruA [bacterium]|nr:tRNA pseudouridine(38-40) synthase TruA [bacterium]
MERYQIILGYDGTAFFGMQRQADARTVQGELENALRKIGWTGSSILVAGRTDAGVHAKGQVATFDLDWQHSTDDLRNALNANLPEDIGVQRALSASPDFHPRFDALSRTYRYWIISQEGRDPTRERYAWRVWPQPDHKKLLFCAEMLQGEHDFAAFGTPPVEGGTTIRLVHQSAWAWHENALVYTVTANAFLYHMVRRMVHLQVAVGLGKSTPDTLDQALSGRMTEMIQGLAPAQGLFLESVKYPEKRSA